MRKILIIRLGAVGDVIRTMPVLKVLRKKYPNIKIDWLVEDRAFNILEKCKLIDEIIVVPRKKITKLFKERRFYETYKSIRKIICYLRDKNYFVVYDFHGILKSGLFSMLTRASIRIGFAPGFSKELNFLFNKKIIKPSSKYITRIEKNFSLIEEEDNIPELDYGIYISNEDKKFIDTFLENNQLTGKKIIGINPAVSKYGQYKEWNEDYYGKLINLIKTNFTDYEFVLTWGPGEEEKVKRIQEYAGVKTLLPPLTSLKQLIYLISKFKFFVTGDTGPMHLAETVDTRVIALFGPSDVQINKPFKKDNVVVYKNVGCNPCRNRKCKDLKCQNELTPEFVYDKIKDMF